MALYKQDIAQGREAPSYQKLKRMVRFFLMDAQIPAHKKSSMGGRSGLPAKAADEQKEK